MCARSHTQRREGRGEWQRDGDGGGGGERERERDDNTLLHKDKDLSTSRLFYKSIPDDKHSNTRYVKQEYK